MTYLRSKQLSLAYCKHFNPDIKVHGDHQLRGSQRVHVVPRSCVKGYYIYLDLSNWTSDRCAEVILDFWPLASDFQTPNFRSVPRDHIDDLPPRDDEMSCQKHPPLREQ